IGTQFYRLTKEEIKQWYRDKLLTTAGYLLAIKKVTKMPGSNMVIPNVLQFCREWEISKSAFYRAVNELRQKGYMDWEATHGIILKETKKVVSFPSDENCPDSETDCPTVETECPTSGTVSHERDSDSHARDGVSHSRDGVSHKRDSVSHKRENRGSKTAQHKNFSVPTDQSDRSDPIQTLSEGERESFIKFSRKKAASLPNPPQLPMKWIKTNFEELHSEWLETKNEKQNRKAKYNFEAMREAQHKMFYEQLQSVARDAVDCNDTGLYRFFVDDFNKSWFNWAKSARADVRELLANNSILQFYSYD
ncbi:MAG: hypothetical protein AAFS12_07480, partial [Cyanobacteria bacterium J06632_19]